MLAVFFPIFVANTEIIFGYDFVAPLILDVLKELHITGKGMGKQKYSKVTGFSWVRQKSIQTLRHKINKFTHQRTGIGKLKKFAHCGCFKIFKVKQR